VPLTATPIATFVARTLSPFLRRWPNAFRIGCGGTTRFWATALNCRRLLALRVIADCESRRCTGLTQGFPAEN